MATNTDYGQRVDAAVAEGKLSEDAAARIHRWLTEPAFDRYLRDLTGAIDRRDWAELDNAFYEVLDFGTGGRRGRMYPVGTNVLNERTIAESARGLADYIGSRVKSDAARSCVIARDARRNSSAFADCCARVLAAAGFKVYLFEEPRSTPLLSFAVRHLGCDAGIMITASHNPPTDNGFKCYASTGGQVVPPDDEGIIACVKALSDREIPETPLKDAREAGSVVTVGSEIDEAFIAAVVAESVSKERGLSIVYTPMHGVGATACAAALTADGFERVNVLASQATPDPDFTNVPGHVANPEVPETLGPAIEEAKTTGADLVIASDPDADRIGVAVPVTGDPKGDWTTLTGNQIGVLLTAFVIEQVKAADALRNEHYIVTTLVSTPMARVLAEAAGVRRVEDDLLVGFKWIGQRIDRAGPSNFLFGFEESHGYLKGTHVRDKDAAVAALLFAELAATLKARGETVLQYLDRLYRAHGHYGEDLINKVYEGREGLAKIKKLMAALRADPPLTVGGLAVTQVDDYDAHETRRPGSSSPPTPLPEPDGDLLIFDLDAPGTRFAARPSGTEPKIKFYLFARTDTAAVSDAAGLDRAKTATRDRLKAIGDDIRAYIAKVNPEP